MGTLFLRWLNTNKFWCTEDRVTNCPNPPPRPLPRPRPLCCRHHHPCRPLHRPSPSLSPASLVAAAIDLLVAVVIAAFRRSHRSCRYGTLRRPPDLVAVAVARLVGVSSSSLVPPSPSSSPATLVAVAIARLIVVSLSPSPLGSTSSSSSPPRPANLPTALTSSSLGPPSSSRQRSPSRQRNQER